MMMLIHKICMALRGLGNRSNVDTAISDKAAMLLQQHSTKTRITVMKQDEYDCHETRPVLLL